jgi:ATP synthase subunit 6
MFLNSPLEQFVLLPVFDVVLIKSILHFTSTNMLLTEITIFVFLVTFLINISSKPGQIFVIPTRWQYFFESLYTSTISLVKDNLQIEEKDHFFPIISITFILILFLNVYGIIPYTFTVTCQLIVTFSLSLFIFIAINILAVLKHKIKIFSLFLPSGVSIPLAFLLVPIELISFFFKPISLAIRLFVNIVAGHTMLKIIAGFVLSIMSIANLYFIFHILPLFLITILFFLETGVAIIQAFVFSVLFCIYLNDLYNLH